jgi:hypothetical protein
VECNEQGQQEKEEPQRGICAGGDLKWRPPQERNKGEFMKPPKTAKKNDTPYININTAY